jgi:hypothetical protein
MLNTGDALVFNAKPQAILKLLNPTMTPVARSSERQLLTYSLARRLMGMVILGALVGL